MAKPKVGDIVEIRTSNGLAYAQISHVHDMYGTLLRIMPHFFAARPRIFSEIIQGKEKFAAFVALNAPVKKRLMAIVGNEPVPLDAMRFPIFRVLMPNLVTKRAENWGLWDGKKSWKVDKLSDEQQRFPDAGVWGDELLIERLENDWAPGRS